MGIPPAGPPLLKPETSCPSRLLIFIVSYQHNHPLRLDLDHGGSIISLSCRTPVAPDTYSLPSPTSLLMSDFNILLDKKTSLPMITYLQFAIAAMM